MAAGYVDSGTIAHSGTYTVGAGSNRRFIVIGAIAKDTGTPTFSATYGGVSMSLDAQSAYIGDYKIIAFSLVDASIPGGSNALSVTAASGTILTPFYGAAYTLSGRDQTTALDAAFTDSGSATAATTLTTASITNTTGSFLLAGIRNAPADVLDTRPSGWTHRVTNTTSQMFNAEDKDDAAAATSTYAWTNAAVDWIYLTTAYKAAAAASSIAAIANYHRRARMS